MVLLDYMTNYKYYIYTTTINMATKRDRVVTYNEEFPPIKLHDLVVL